ncbi:MAG: hypothetical protein RIS76_4718 [Verrucomicrobiota bacterium]
MPATLARKPASWILTETMEARPEVGLRSYDRLFPNQDTMPRGGFGNLIALPLQRLACEHGNSVFIDDSFTPHADQWAYLDAHVRIPRAQLEDWTHDGDSRGRVVGVRLASVNDEVQAAPWNLPPSRRPRDEPTLGALPANLDIVLADQICLSKAQSIAPAGTAQSSAATGGVPESRILPGSVPASDHLQDTSDSLLCRGHLGSPGPATRLPG